MDDGPPLYGIIEPPNWTCRKDLRTLLPPMKNIVWRLVIESAAEGCDVIRKAYKLTLDSVVHELKDEAVWFDRFDWFERKRNHRLEAHETEQRRTTMEERSNSQGTRPMIGGCDVPTIYCKRYRGHQITPPKLVGHGFPGVHAPIRSSSSQQDAGKADGGESSSIAIAGSIGMADVAKN
ncbi:hypothetical protein IW261DRAFT_1665521 [Armillaria novae-zelandiae]|uniref:Uncharacterized protein n=1 Tax=Armillaria novae-zelandiae TaxID=153914 RepID=A0AA39T8X9_9AGAR|nr:hypothetical protein IW261DRAFT_1665521 [Armillaria novae-zelandiae]